MSKMRQGRKRVIACMIAAFVALGTVFTAVTPTIARADEAAVRKVGEGVFKFNWRYQGEDFSRGSCFLINDRYVLTCWHCAMFNKEERKLISDRMKKYRNKDISTDVKDFLKEFTYSVTVYRDMQKEAELVNYSEEEDWAIFKLKSPVGNSTPLKFRDSKEVEAAETVWSVGFPANSDEAQFVSTYRQDDVTIKQGTISKPEGAYDVTIPTLWWDFFENKIVETKFNFKGDYLQTTCPISGGDSGGPMVDDAGNIIGISEISSDAYYYCIANHSIMTALDRLQIEYATVDGTKTVTNTDTTDDGKGDETTTTTDVTTGSSAKELSKDSLNAAIDDAKSIDEGKYTEESYKTLKDALKKAEEAADLKLDDPTDDEEFNKKDAEIASATKELKNAIDGLEEKGGLSPAIIAAIVAGSLAVIGGIIGAIVAMTKRNKNKAAAPTGAAPQAGYNAPAAAPAPVPNAAPAPAPAPAAAPVPSAPGTTVLGADAPGTTVLGDDAPPTDVLSESVNGGTLTRMSTNEKIPINRSEVTLGRERRSVDYCLEGNTNIGRVHARVVVRNGQVFIVDNNSTNGTFVNNAKLRPGLEQQLKSGDIIRLADEKFRYDQ